MNKIAFLSMDDLGVYICDDDMAAVPLQDLGWRVKTVSWRDKSARWERYAAVVIRSTWDYQNDLQSFLDLLAEIDSKTFLANSLQTVRWNADKSYLLSLAKRGVKIVPTLCGERFTDEMQIERWCDTFETDEIVIKPAVSASANNTFRLSREERHTFRIASVFACRPFIVQPFMRNIVEEGEYSLFYFGGVYSHAILKKPAPGDFRVQEEYFGEVRSIEPPEEMISSGKETLLLLDELPLYARVDYVRDEHNRFALMELELIEPSLYFRMASGSAERFAKAVDEVLEGRE